MTIEQGALLENSGIDDSSLDNVFSMKKAAQDYIATV